MKFNFKGKETFIEVFEAEEIGTSPTKYQFIAIPINPDTKTFEKFKKVYEKDGGNENTSADFNLTVDVNTEKYWKDNYKIDERTGEAVHTFKGRIWHCSICGKGFKKRVDVRWHRAKKHNTLRGSVG